MSEGPPTDTDSCTAKCGQKDARAPARVWPRRKRVETRSLPSSASGAIPRLTPESDEPAAPVRVQPVAARHRQGRSPALRSRRVRDGPGSLWKAPPEPNRRDSGKWKFGRLGRDSCAVCGSSSSQRTSRLRIKSHRHGRVAVIHQLQVKRAKRLDPTRCRRSRRQHGRSLCFEQSHSRSTAPAPAATDSRPSTDGC